MYTQNYPLIYVFGPQLFLDNLSTSASTTLNFTNSRYDRAGIWFASPSTNTSTVHISIVECVDNTTFARNAVIDLTPGEKRMFFIKHGQSVYAYSSSASQDLVAYEVSVESPLTTTSHHY
jgi:hypothetical protein